MKTTAKQEINTIEELDNLGINDVSNFCFSSSSSQMYIQVNGYAVMSGAPVSADGTDVLAIFMRRLGKYTNTTEVLNRINVPFYHRVTFSEGHQFHTTDFPRGHDNVDAYYRFKSDVYMASLSKASDDVTVGELRENFLNEHRKNVLQIIKEIIRAQEEMEAESQRNNLEEPTVVPQKPSFVMRFLKWVGNL